MKARLLLPLAFVLLIGATSFAQISPRKAYFQSTEIVTPEWRPEWYRLNRYFGLQDIGGVVGARKSTDEVTPPAATFLVEGHNSPEVTFKVTEDTAKEGIDFVIPSKTPVISEGRFGDTFCWGQIPFFILDRKLQKRRTFTIELVSVLDTFGDPIPIDPTRAKCTVVIYGVKVRK